MSVVQLLKKFPLAVKIRKHFRAKAFHRGIFSKVPQLERLTSARGKQLAKAVAMLQQPLGPEEKQWSEKIEQQRKLLSQRQTPLVDGTLDVESGLYDEGLTVEETCRASKPIEQAMLLFALTRVVDPMHVIELGTNVGISSAYIGAALKANGRGGQVVTLDASPYRQRLAKEIHANLGLDNVSYRVGLFSDTLGPCLEESNQLDLAFIDGHHQYQPTLDYYRQIVPYSAADGVFVFDDIMWSDGMKKAWSELQEDKRFPLTVDLTELGVCCLGDEGSDKICV